MAGVIRLGWCVGLASLALDACTPIPAPGHAQDRGDTDAHLAAGSGGSARANPQTAAPPAQGGDHTPGTACDTNGLTACKDAQGTERLLCKDGTWDDGPSCKSSERCVRNGAAVGGTECMPLPTDCLGHEAGVTFCDGATLKVCDKTGQSTSIACSTNERCLTQKASSKCACVPGAHDTDNGCELASDCSRGACDPLTTCTPSPGGRVCGACPPGYSGDGATGCAATVLSATLSCGTLMAPAAGSSDTELRIAVPLLCQTPSLKLQVPDGTAIAINSKVLSSDGMWTSDLLPLGTTRVSIALTAASGVSSHYTASFTRTGHQAAFLKASNPGASDRLGASVAVDKGTIVGGAPYEDGGAGGVNPQASGSAANSGAAYVFVQNGERWPQQALLKADTATSNEYFGSSVAVLDDVIAVGAPANDPTAQPSSVRNPPGAVYLFKRTGDTWKQAFKLVPDDATGGDMFGFQVLLTADKLLVTAPFEGSQVSESGATYVYQRDGTKLTKLTKLKSSKPFSLAGWGVGLAYDGTTIAVGAFSDSSTVLNAGSASVFTEQDGSWKEQQYLQAGKLTQGATFGLSMAVQGDLLLVGAPRWGHYIETPAGEVYVWKRTGEHWNQIKVLTAFQPRNQDFFGSSLVLTPNLVLIGANGDASSSPGIPADPTTAPCSRPVRSICTHGAAMRSPIRS